MKIDHKMNYKQSLKIYKMKYKINNLSNKLKMKNFKIKITIKIDLKNIVIQTNS
jgi:hypothetical protein